jgi:site-specific DNA-cytosine methylase
MTVYVIDLFCGAGGFSEGARQAGCEVVLAVDMWKEALDVHADNHPACEHWCEQLGGSLPDFAKRIREFIASTVPEGGRLHIHGSPPCQNLTAFNHCRKNTEVGLHLVEWTLKLISELRPHTWTMEQVRNASVISMIREYGGQAHTVNMSDYGLSATRKRVIGGTIDEDMLLLQKQNGCGFDEMLRGIGTITEYTHISCGTRKRGERMPGGSYNSRPISDIAFTVTHAFPTFYDPVTNKLKCLSTEMAQCLQGFPSTYRFSKRARLMIANSVPPIFASKVMKCIIDTPPDSVS